MAALKFLLFLAWLGLVWGLEQVRYDNYSVYKVFVDDAEQLKLINAKEQSLKVG